MSVVATGRRMKSVAKFIACLRLPTGGLTEMRTPGVRRSWPSVTTSSPTRTPLVTTASSPDVRATSTGRSDTVLSAPTTYTNCPCWPFWTADAGTTTACASMANWSVTCTRSPGHSRWSALANVPFSLIVPVAGSAALSMNETTPVEVLPGITGRSRRHGQRGARLAAANLAEVLPRHGKDDANRRELVDDDER